MSAELLTKELDDDSIVEPQITEGVTMTKPTIAILLAAVFFLSACEKASSPAPKPQPAAALPATLMLANAPSDAKPVEDAKSAARVGEIVTISGKIGGMMKPFAEDRAVFTLVGPGIPSCADTPGDTCTTPWDYCCETSEDIAAHAATINVVDDSGKVIKATLKGVGGMKELSTVTVVGKVRAIEGASLVIDAQGIFVATK